MRTVEGSELTFAQPSIGRITITDLIGNVATIMVPDVAQSNGIIHVADTVLLPSWRDLRRYRLIKGTFGQNLPGDHCKHYDGGG